MKGYHSNSKLIFAYQDTVSRAAAKNNALDSNDTSNCVVRVVEPKDGSNSVTTHPNYDSDGTSLEQYGSDFLVSATISAILQQGSTGTTIIVGGGIERFKSVTTVTTPGRNRIVDILLSQDVIDLINQADVLYKAVIELVFSSGDSEDLILNLKPVDKCSLQINPDDITGDGKFNCSTTLQTLIAQNYPELSGSRVAYSISKAYRKLNQKKNATITPHQANGNLQTRGLYGIGFTGYTPFSAPFGFISNQLVSDNSGISGLSAITPTAATVPWLNSPGDDENTTGISYATTTTTHLTWFTGRADMTATRLLKNSGEYGGTDHAPLHRSLQEAGINISPFFATGVNADRITGSETLGDILHAEPTFKGQGNDSKLQWGRSFGWFSSLVRGNIVDQNGTTVIAENSQNYGVPPIFRENQYAPNSGTTVDRPLDFWGAFQSNLGAFNGTQVEDYVPTSNSGVSTNAAIATSIRYSKLFWGAGDNIPGTSVSSTAIANAFSIDPVAGSYLSQLNYLSTRNSFAYLPSPSNLPLSSDTQDLRRIGSVSDIITTPNANFFYPGCAGSYSDPYVPIFKGIARVITTTRVGVTGTNTAGMAGLALLQMANDGQNLSFLDVYGIYLGQSGYVEQGSGATTADNYFSKVDLDHSVFFMGHTYPRHATGTLAEQVSPHLPNFEQYSGYNQLWTAGWNMLKDEGDSVPGNTNVFACIAQDIVFFVSGYVPTSSGQYIANTNDDKARSITRNHPMSGLGFNQETNTITLPRIHFAETSDVSQANKPFTATSIPFHADLAENNANAIPPYPYSPNFYEVITREYFPGFAGPSNPGDGTGYFNSLISANGTDFNTVVDAIILPTSTTGTLPYVYSGNNQCFAIKSATVTIEDTAGVGLINLTGNRRLVYKLTYINNCSGEFQTSLGEKTVTVDDYPAIADRVSKVLEIFPFIEYRPLAALNTFDGTGLEFTIQVQDENDVDDIYIEQPFNGGGEYVLTVVIDNLDDDAGDSIIFSDSTIPAFPTTDVPYFSPWQIRYLSVVGEADFKTHKASYITVASSSSWPTFTQGNSPYQGLIPADTDRFAYHAPFFTPGLAQVEDNTDPPNDDIPGCTDPNAINYNSNATIDNGSCAECDSYIISEFAWNIANNGINNGSNGMRVGVYNPDNLPGGYLYGLAGGNTAVTQYLDLSGQGNNLAAVYNSTGANYGGAVVADNDFVDNNPFVNLSIRAVNQGNNSFQQILEWMSIQFGETYQAWELKIRAMSDPLESLNFEQSYSPNNPYDIANYTTLPVAYSSVATGGSITEPTWDDISLATQQPLTWLETGRAFLLELHLNPNNVPVECTLLNDTNNIVLGIMWVTLCSCADVTNEYFGVAMNGISPYPWQGSNPFPILPYAPTSNCPDTIDPNNAYGDGAYPNNICFTPDAATGDCEQYWDFCISDFNVDCSSDTNNTTVINGVEYFNYDSGYISTTINGVYNPYTDQYVYDPNIQYSITVTGPGGYNETQNQDFDTTPNSNVFTNTFDGVTAPGLYTVTYTFFGPYVDYFSDPTYLDNGACILTNEVTIPSPVDSGCGDIVLGCTDPGFDNFDPNATVDDGSCENVDPCEDALNNSSFLFTTDTTNSTSTCLTDIIIINGEPYEATVPSPDNNGIMAVSISYTPPESGLAINTFAVLLINTVSASPGIQNILDSVAILFSSPPTDEINGVSIDGIGYWSPLNTVGAGTQLFLEQFTGLPPGNYYVLVVANPTVESLADCGEGAFATIQDFFTVVNIGLDAPDEDCPEPCLGPNCEDYVLGCTDPDADNYNPDATFDDGSCEPEQTACEQDPNDPACYDCADELSGVAPRYATGNVDEPPCESVTGSDGYCTDPNACNYDPDAPLDLSNNLICDYCSCNGEDPDCFEDSDCDPDLDPNCGGPEPECPDPSNPDCDPTIYDPCPGDDCGPPLDPCLILGNCPDDEGGDGLDEDNFFDEVNPVEVTCIPDIETTNNSQLNFGAVQQQAFQCMSQEGQKMLFRMKSGAYYDDTDVLKLSLIAYLFAGGLNKTELPCIFNCNYESADKARAYSCGDTWVAGGTKYYNSTDSYSRGDVIVYYYKKGSKITRSFYTAVRDVTPFDVAPRFPNSGWTRCQDIKLRTADRNGIATGEEEYLQIFWEFLTRFCNDCTITASPVEENENNVDPKVLKNYLDPKTTNTNVSNRSGILGEDGEEIIF